MFWWYYGIKWNDWNRNSFRLLQTSFNRETKKYLIDYFEEDLSLTEIAEMNEVSRQAVYDNIKRGCKILRDYEDKLNFYKKDRKLYNELVNLRKNFTKENLDKIIEKMS